MSRLSAVLVLSAMAQMCAFAGSYYVDVDNASASDSNPGTEVLPFKTIQAAVEAAEDSGSGYSYSDGDTIWVKPGVYDAGGREGSNGFTNRVYITKPLRIVSTQGKEKTSIVGAWDPNGSNGCGPAAVRCVYVASTVANAIIRGFTITKGATPSWTTDTSANYSGGIFGTSSSIWIVECTVSECRARRFPAMYYCTGVRTLYVHNKSDYVWGTVGGQSRFLNCVLWANGNGNKYTPVEYGTVVNCTLVDNLKNGYDSASVYNTIVVSSGGSANDYCMTSTSSNIISTASHGSRQIMSSATGDFRLLPTSAAIGAGERSLLTKITLPAELSDQQYKDYLGADIVEKDGRINCGAVQAVGSPKGGGIVLNFTAEVDDSFSSVISGSYVFGELYPTQHIVKPVISTAGSHVYALRIDPRLDNLDGLYPDPENRFYLAPSPNANTNDVYNLLTSSNVKWVDPDPEGLGSDDNDGNTESTPYKTLEKAMVFARSNQRTIVYCKKGVYDEAPTGSYRLSMPNSYYCFVRAVDGPENTVIRGGAGIGCVSMPYFGALQGFTLTGADTSGSAVNAAVRVYQQNRLTWLLDCIVSNNVSGSEAVLSGPWLQRCLVAGNRAAAKVMYKTQLSSSVACNNVSDGDDYIIHEGKAWQSTIYNADGGKLLRDVNCYNSIVVGGGEVSASCSGAGNTIWGTTCEAAGWTVQNPLLVNPGDGDCRVAPNSPTICGGEKPTDGNYAAVDVKGWRMLSTSTLDGQPLHFGADGTPDAGAIQYDHQSFVLIREDDAGGLSVSGDAAVGSTVVAKGETVAFTISRGASSRRRCIGFTANGTYVSFDDYPSGWTTNYTAAADALDISAVFSNAFYAAPDGDDANDGWTPATAKTLHGALAYAQKGETVLATAGTYGSAVGKVKNSESDLIWCRAIVPDGVTLESVDGPEATFIVGEPAPGGNAKGCGTNAVRCVRLLGTGRVRGFTLTGGRTLANAQGGAESAKYGSAAYADNGKAYVENCIISNNVARRGAGAYATFVGCRFFENRCDEYAPAAIFGVYLNCIFDRNRGIDTCEYTDALVNCTFGPNNKNEAGTASTTEIWGTGPSYKVKNCLFLGCAGGTSSGNLSNCVFIAGNGNLPNPSTYGHGIANCVFTNLADLALAPDGLHPTAASSVLVDKGSMECYDAHGNSATDKTVDADGLPRVLNGGIDIGCFEFDWRGVYAADLAKKVRVTSASPSVVETPAKAVRLSGGDAVALAWKGPAAVPAARSFPFEVSGGTLTVKVNGDAVASFSADGQWKYEGGAGTDAIEFSFEAASAGGHADLLRGSSLAGAILIYR